MKFEQGWYMPESETHLVERIKEENQFVILPAKGRGTYQFPKFWLSMVLLPQKGGNAIDIGSNIGLWTYYLVDYFERVHCFEPVEILRNCWYKNLKNYNNVTLYPVALGNKEEIINMYMPKYCTGGAYIGDKQGSNQDIVENIEIDKLDNYNLKDIIFIKIDVQGYELEVVKGGKNTILENKPMIVIEQKENKDAVKYLEDLGMIEFCHVRGDYFMGWKQIDAEYAKRINDEFTARFIP